MQERIQPAAEGEPRLPEGAVVCAEHAEVVDEDCETCRAEFTFFSRRRQ